MGGTVIPPGREDSQHFSLFASSLTCPGAILSPGKNSSPRGPGPGTHRARTYPESLPALPGANRTWWTGTRSHMCGAVEEGDCVCRSGRISTPSLYTPTPGLRPRNILVLQGPTTKTNTDSARLLSPQNPDLPTTGFHTPSQHTGPLPGWTEPTVQSRGVLGAGEAFLQPARPQAQGLSSQFHLPGWLDSSPTHSAGPSSRG